MMVWTNRATRRAAVSIRKCQHQKRKFCATAGTKPSRDRKPGIGQRSAPASRRLSTRHLAASRFTPVASRFVPKHRALGNHRQPEQDRVPVGLSLHFLHSSEKRKKISFALLSLRRHHA